MLPGAHKSHKTGAEQHRHLTNTAFLTHGDGGMLKEYLLDSTMVSLKTLCKGVALVHPKALPRAHSNERVVLVQPREQHTFRLM